MLGSVLSAVHCLPSHSISYCIDVFSTCALRNSGVIGGKFLENTRVSKPGSTIDNPVFYMVQDFAIGAVIVIFKHKFVIADTDKYVLNYMEARPEEFSTEALQALKTHHQARS